MSSYHIAVPQKPPLLKYTQLSSSSNSLQPQAQPRITIPHQLSFCPLRSELVEIWSLIVRLVGLACVEFSTMVGRSRSWEICHSCGSLDGLSLAHTLAEDDSRVVLQCKFEEFEFVRASRR